MFSLTIGTIYTFLFILHQINQLYFLFPVNFFRFFFPVLHCDWVNDQKFIEWPHKHHTEKYRRVEEPKLSYCLEASSQVTEECLVKNEWEKALEDVYDQAKYCKCLVHEDFCAIVLWRNEDFILKPNLKIHTCLMPSMSFAEHHIPTIA